MSVQLLLGAVFALGFVVCARWVAREQEIAVFATGLAAAALIYFIFAVDGAGTTQIGTEAAGLVVFSTLAALAFRRSSWFVAVGWALHAGWDALLHLAAAPTYAPDWYPPVCLAFDLVVAAYLAARMRGYIQAPLPAE